MLLGCLYGEARGDEYPHNLWRRSLCLMKSHMVVSTKWGTPIYDHGGVGGVVDAGAYRPQHIIILIIGTPKKVPLILGTPMYFPRFRV